MQPHGCDALGALGIRFRAEPRQHGAFKLIEIITKLCLARGDRNLASGTHAQHAAPHRAVALMTIRTPPTNDRDSKSRQQIGMVVENAPSLRDATAGLLEAAKGRMDPVVYRRARHVIGEIERTVHAAVGVRASNWPTVGQLMYASHVSLRDDYEVSCDELDAVVESAKGIGIQGGVYGCRMTGGGFGGCCVALVKADAVDAITRQITADYQKRIGREATIFVSRPAAGATVLKS